MTQTKLREDLVVVRQYSYRHEAEMGRTMLEANGVDAMIVADDCGGQRPLVGANIGVKLVVRRRDEHKATMLLK